MMLFMKTGRPTSRPRTAFGERLAYFRRSRGVTQKQLAEELGITQSAIANWERRSVTLSPEQIATLSRVLGISLDELFGTNSIPKELIFPGGRIRDVFTEVGRLPRRQQEKIVDVVEAYVEKKLAHA
jgi:transcriptional regulator with XRE-family HTH domain